MRYIGIFGLNFYISIGRPRVGGEEEAEEGADWDWAPSEEGRHADMIQAALQRYHPEIIVLRRCIPFS